MTISSPKVYETPLSFGPHPLTPLSGSDHNKSHITPLSGIDKGLLISLTYLSVIKSGDNPPCIQNILLSTNAAIGI